MILVAILIGIGYYHFDIFSIKKIKLQEKNEVTIPQTDVNDDVEVVRVLLLFHAADYFVYRGVPTGFQYDLLRELGRAIGKSVSIKIETDENNIRKELFGNNYDIIVMDFNHRGFLVPIFELSISHSYSYPVLVVGTNADTTGIRTISVSNDFAAKLFFMNDSPFSRFTIQKENDSSTEELFEKLDNGEITYMICDYNQALTLKPFYSNVKILDKAGPQFERRWYLNKNNVQLNENINHWLLDFKKTTKYRSLLRKYFSLSSTVINTSFAKKREGALSQFDDIIKKHAKQYHFDWRFVASIICQETKFISGLTGRGGSYGLMQLMPATMEYFGISETDGEDVMVRAGIQYLNTIRKSFDDIEDEEERLYFVAASYNAGRGHIFDAQRLCTKYGEDYTKWNDVAKYLKMKSKREIIADTLVKSGYFPGSHTVKYVQQVMERYEAYKMTVK